MFNNYNIPILYSEPVDFQLPKNEDFVEHYEYPEPEPEPTPKEFQEKVVESLEGGETSFKKRKFGNPSKRNTRQRLDDD